MKLVYVEWVDSRGVSENWNTFAWLKENDICVVRSVGWLLQDTKELIQIVPHIGDDPEQGCGDMTIPRSQVKRMTALKLPKTKKKGR